jgi:hypothetical protein
MKNCKLACVCLSLAAIGISPGCCSFRDVTAEHPELLGDARLIDGSQLTLMRISKPTRCYGYFEYEIRGAVTADGRDSLVKLEERQGVRVVQVFEQDFLIGRPDLVLAVEAATGGSEGLPSAFKALIAPSYIAREE